MTFKKLVLVGLIGLTSSMLVGQSVSSPYSINGIGDISFQGLPNNYGMGEVGIGVPTPWHINIQNPANLIYNQWSSFQVGIMTDFRKYASQEDDHSSASAGLRFLTMSFPVVRSRWITGLSLTPLSSVQYGTFSADSVGGVLRTSQSQGSGGLTQLTWANGFRLYESLAVGFKASYVFGEITKSTIDRLSGLNVNTAYAVAYSDVRTYSDLLFTAALSYRQNLGENKNLSFGAIYDFSNTISGRQDLYFERQNQNGNALQRNVLAEDERITYDLPRAYGVGISYGKLNVIRIGADFKLNQWKSSSTEASNNTLRDTYSLGAGLSWTPDYQSVTSYLSRASYRMGLNVKQLPYLVNNTEINDFGINFGASFPVSGYSSLDFAFKYGFRGTTQNSLIRENYFQVILGATINDDRWFLKRTYD